MISTVIAVIIGLVILAYIIYVLIHPNTKNISDHFRGDDGKYE